jgi:hypothetical protein
MKYFISLVFLALNISIAYGVMHEKLFELENKLLFI